MSRRWLYLILLLYFVAMFLPLKFHKMVLMSIDIIFNEMFVGMLTVHCDQNDSYEITKNGFQVRNIDEIRNVIFGLRYGKPSSVIRP